ncbi:MAG TPA: hypothetical protein VJG90_02870 [Candidatus Nanoarchaeia archaeon]|nr:hypothetical protein [Candidatus Nanoarchaeia archaeon]
MDFRKQIVQLEMDKFGMDKELSRLKTRLVERELSWPEYQTFKYQLLGGKSHQKYFSDINRQVALLQFQQKQEKNQQELHRHTRHHFFFAGMVFFFIATLVVGWYQGWAGIQGFTVKEFTEPIVFLDKTVYQVGEPVYIHVLPKEAPYMLTLVKDSVMFNPTAQVFVPQEPGDYHLQVVVEWKEELKKVEILFKVE